MPVHAHLAAQDALLPYHCRAGYAAHCRHCGIAAYTDAVGYLAEVVYAYAVFYDGGLGRGAVYGGIGAYLHIVADNHVAHVLDLLPAAVGAADIAEAVVPYYAAGVQDDAVSYIRFAFRSHLLDIAEPVTVCAFDQVSLIALVADLTRIERYIILTDSLDG